jgi:hypothetical protein
LSEVAKPSSDKAGSAKMMSLSWMVMGKRIFETADVTNLTEEVLKPGDPGQGFERYHRGTQARELSQARRGCLYTDLTMACEQNMALQQIH